MRNEANDMQGKVSMFRSSNSSNLFVFDCPSVLGRREVTYAIDASKVWVRERNMPATLGSHNRFDCQDIVELSGQSGKSVSRSNRVEFKTVEN